MTINHYSRYFPVIFFACLLVNWPIFFSDILVNDDLTIVTSNNLDDFKGLKDVYVGQAKPSGYYFHRALAFFTASGTFSYKIYNFLLIAATAMIFFIIARQAWLLTKSTALVATIGFLCFPSIGIQPFAMGTLHFVSYLMFFSGLLLTYRYWRGDYGFKGLIAACICVGIAARMSSTIPFIYVFLLSFLLIELRKRFNKSEEPQYNLVKGCWITLLLTTVMVFTYTIEGFFYQQHTWFGGTYNQLKVDPNYIIDSIIAIITGIQSTFFNHFLTVSNWPIARLAGLVISSIVILAIVIKVRGKKQIQLEEGNVTSYVFLSVIAVCALVMAIFPYAAVGKIPASEGYQTRWAILVGVSGALSIALVYELGRVSRHKAGQWLGVTLTAFLCSSFTLLTWDHYGNWQRVALENSAMISKMKLLDFRPEVDVFCVDTNIVSEKFYIRRWYDWAYVYSQSWDTNRETMGFHKDYCERHGLYPEGELKTNASVVEVTSTDASGMKALSSWMYHGKGQDEYRLAEMRIVKGDDRMDHLSGVLLLRESLKHKFFSSEVIGSYVENLHVFYD